MQAQHSSLREMARGYWEEKRQKKSRLMKVDGHDVLRENNYDMQVSLKIRFLLQVMACKHGWECCGRTAACRQAKQI